MSSLLCVTRWMLYSRRKAQIRLTRHSTQWWTSCHSWRSQLRARISTKNPNLQSFEAFLGFRQRMKVIPLTQSQPLYNLSILILHNSWPKDVKKSSTMHRLLLKHIKQPTQKLNLGFQHSETTVIHQPFQRPTFKQNSCISRHLSETCSVATAGPRYKWEKFDRSLCLLCSASFRVASHKPSFTQCLAPNF